MSSCPDPSAGDDLAYAEAWTGRIRDDELSDEDSEQNPEDPPNE